MKNILKLFVLILMMTTCVSAMAQQDKQRDARIEHAKRKAINSVKQREIEKVSREELAERQAKYIAKQMALDDATTQKYVATFCQYQKDVWALKKPQKRTADRSDADVEQAMKERFEHSQKLLDLRKKYYAEYCKFLTPRQVEQAYQYERKMMNRLHKRAHQNRNAKHPMRNKANKNGETSN